MQSAHNVILRKLNEHSRLHPLDETALRSLSVRIRRLRPDEDLMREGDEPEASALVLEGMVARYHALANGKRQYLSFRCANAVSRKNGSRGLRRRQGGCRADRARGHAPTDAAAAFDRRRDLEGNADRFRH